MANIDWSKQNPNYPLWLEGKGEHVKHSGWYRRAGEVFEHETHGQFRAVREGQFFDVHVKPEWNGEGLPPVGSRCECSQLHGKWAEGEVIAHHWEGAIVAIGDNEKGFEYDSYQTNQVRPIRTPEQIAEDERYKAVHELADVLRGHAPQNVKAAFALYDAGYRKQVIE